MLCLQSIPERSLDILLIGWKLLGSDEAPKEWVRPEMADGSQQVVVGLVLACVGSRTGAAFPTNAGRRVSLLYGQ